ncbi:MAG: CPBP family intramembrane glutamic endopeptidase [Thermoguttaceae bacterium]|jgi:membrane protease YdiL (CAAX protease family)
MPDQTTHNPFYSRAEYYWVQSRRPVVSLVFIAPLLAIYEAGVLIWGVQNGADAWMRQFLDLMGFSQHWLLPLLTVCVLLGWHYLTHEPWRFSPGVLSPMVAECLLLAICLQVVLVFQGTLLLSTGQASGPSIAAKMVGYLGAGIYEELLFRLILLSATLWLIRRWWTAQNLSLVLAVLVSSLIFAAAHYVGGAGDDFHWFSFLFRFMAGVFFSILFIYRGFGIAVGAHAAYDILAILFLRH